ncbi:MAG: CPBP family intramembrane glutamic endopeptidase [Caldilineaceae bacterium]
MSTQGLTPTNILQERSTSHAKDQYTLWQILGIWLAAGAPMWLLGWVAYPMLSAGLPPVDAGLLRLQLLTGGLIGSSCWRCSSSIAKKATSGGAPSAAVFGSITPFRRRPATKKSLWWWLVPLLLLLALLEIGLRSPLVHLWTTIFPFFAEPEGYGAAILFAPALRTQWVGDWGLLGLFLVTATFNTFLGEEILFRGVLLPRMAGVFGKWDWVANGFLFCFYHLHQPWGILATLPGDLLFAYAGKRFHSNWFPIILHSGQSIYFLILILGLILGLA